MSATLSNLSQIEREMGEDEKLSLFWDILSMGYVGIAPFEHSVHGSTVLTVQQFAEPDQFGMAFYPGYETEVPLGLVVGNKEVIVEQLLSGEMKDRWSFFPATESFNPAEAELNSVPSED